MKILSKRQIILLHAQLIEQFGGASAIRDEGLLDSALNSPFQTFNGTELYPTLITKASRLCYGLVKNHPFIDGNKRIGSLLFIVFLTMNDCHLTKNGETKISDRALTALALLIAESNPKEKPLLIALICKLLEN